MNYKHFFEVTEERFYKFIKEKKLRAHFGIHIHATDYTDSDGNVLAIMESSSYNPHIVYQIASENPDNENTLSFLLKKMKSI